MLGVFIAVLAVLALMNMAFQSSKNHGQGNPQGPGSNPEGNPQGLNLYSCADSSSWLPLDMNQTSNYCFHNRFEPARSHVGVDEIDVKRRFLCKLSPNSKNCKTKFIAEVIDRMIAVAPIYSPNQENQKILYELHDNFIGYMNAFGVQVIAIEGVFPNQNYMKTRPGKEPLEIQLQIEDNYYHRENLINVAARKLWDMWDYLIWIDAHQWLENPFWWHDAIYQMEHQNIVQFFTETTYLTPDNRTSIFTDKGVMYYKSLLPGQLAMIYGNAWGMRKDIYAEIDFIEDRCIAGGCDWLMVFACFNDEDVPIRVKRKIYYDQFWDWVTHTRQVFNGKVSFIPGRLMHFEHAHFFSYFDAQDALDGLFNFTRDLYRDANFTIHLKNYNVRKALVEHSSF